MKVLKESPFRTTHGGLRLVQTKQGAFLELDDCYGPAYYGPLTAEQIEAFTLLCTVKEDARLEWVDKSELDNLPYLMKPQAS